MRRKMVKSELLGQHTHEAAGGQRVHIWLRDSTYLARGRFRRHAFGVTLGIEQRQAVAALHRLLVEIEDGTFCRPSEASSRALKTGPVPRNTVRELCDVFLSEKRRLRGKETARSYRNRLVPLIGFAEQPEVRRKWSLALEVDHEFAIAFRESLYRRTVTRNGRTAAKERPISPGHVYNVLDCTRTLFSWGKRPDINQLPAAFVNPFNEEVVGQRPRKDLLRTSPLPLKRRIQLVAHMDRWQLCQFAIGLILALRPEDYTGLLISDVDFSERRLHFGRRFEGWDFNKGQQSFRVPFPPAIEPVLRECADGREDGPLLRKRTVVDDVRRPKLPSESTDQIREHFHRAVSAAKPGEIQAPQDGKRLFRKLLRDMGGVSADSLSKEFKSLLKKVDVPPETRMYDLRGATNTDMNTAGVSELFQLYVTGHSVEEKILSRYVSLQLDDEMNRYFDHIDPLLQAIVHRAKELELRWTSATA